MKRKALICVALAACMLLSGCDNIGNILKTQTGIISNNVANAEAAKQYKTAIMNGNIEWIEEIIANNPDLDINYCEDETALYCACYDSNIGEYYQAKTVSALLELGVDPNIGNVLQLTAYNKNYYLAKALLQSSDIDLFTTDTLGNTPLSMACTNQDGGSSFDSFRMVDLMVKAGAKPDSKLFQDTLSEDNSIGNHYGTIIISPKATNDLIKLLQKSGEESGLNKAVEYAVSGDIESCLAELKSNGTEQLSNYDLKLILYYTAFFGTPEQFKEIHQDFAPLGFGTDLFSWVAETDNLEMLLYFSDNFNIRISGEDADSFVKKGFEYAARWGFEDICQFYCDNRIHLTNYDRSGYHALKAAVCSEDVETVKTVYQYIKANYGINEFDIGRAYRDYVPENIDNAKKVIDFFFIEGFNMSCIEFGYCDKEIAEYLYQKGRPLTPTDLTYAIFSNNLQYVKSVLDKGAVPNQKSFRDLWGFPWNISYNETTINIEQEYRPAESKEEFEVSYTKFIDYYNNNEDEFRERKGLSILSTAIKRSCSEVVKMLIEYGTDLNSNDYFADCRNGSAATLRVLLEAGANTSLDYRTEKDKEFVSLAEFYERNGRSDLAQIVREYVKN